MNEEAQALDVDVEVETEVEAPTYEGIKEDYHEHIDADLYGSDDKYKEALEKGFDPTRDKSDPNYSNYGNFLRFKDMANTDKGLRSDMAEMKNSLGAFLQTVDEEKDQAVQEAIAALEAKRDQASEDMDTPAALDAQKKITQLENSKVETPVPQDEPVVFKFFRKYNQEFDKTSDSFNPALNDKLETLVNNELQSLISSGITPSDTQREQILTSAHTAVMTSVKTARVPPKITTPGKEKQEMLNINNLTPSSKEIYNTILNSGDNKESAKKRADKFAEKMLGGE